MMICLDVSQSMRSDSPIGWLDVPPVSLAFALASVIVKDNKDCKVVAFGDRVEEKDDLFDKGNVQILELMEKAKQACFLLCSVDILLMLILPIQ